MSTVGNTGTPSQTFAFYGSGASNVMGIEVAMPSPGGNITALNAYFSGHGGAITARLCVWDTGGNLLAQTADVAVSAGSGGIGGQAWRTASLTSALYVASGTNIIIGWWRHSNQSDEWTEQNGGTEWQATDASNTAPGNETFNTGSTGQPGIYATYTALVTPTISSATPNPATVGASVALVGTGFLHATSVSINGASAGFSITDDTHITATVPGGATATGNITVTNPAGTSSGYSFTVGGISYVNTGTPGSPVWTQGSVYVNTGTPGSPVWTIAGGVYVNTGTPGSPVWTLVS